MFFARLTRYAIVVWAGLYFGNRIVELARSSGLRTALIVFAMICIAGTGLFRCEMAEVRTAGAWCNQLTADGID